MLVDAGPKLDLLDLDDPLMFLGLASALLLLVLILPKIHDLADRGHCGRRNLDQVETLLPGGHKRLVRRHDAELFARVVDDADFPDANALVGASANLPALTSEKCDSAPLARGPVQGQSVTFVRLS